MRLYRMAALIGLLEGLMAGCAYAQDHVIVRDLGSYNGAGRTYAYGINNRGDVVGTASGSDGRGIAFLWTASSGFIPLLRDAVATDVNVHREVIGWRQECDALSDECISNGIYWSERRGVLDFGPFIPTSINERGDIAGVCWDLGVVCIVYSGDTSPTPQAQIPFGWVEGMNNRGELISSASGHPVRWSPPDRVTALAILPRTTNAEPRALNDHSWSAGYIWSEGPIGAVWDPPGSIVALVPGCIFSSLNNRGQALGTCDSTPVVWTRRSGATPLLVPSGHLSVSQINDHGQIVGTVCTPLDDWESDCHAVVVVIKQE